MNATDEHRKLAEQFFMNLRYESSRGGIRGLATHHIEQFSASLAVMLADFERKILQNEKEKQ